MARLRIASRWAGDGEPRYFIADISATHDHDLDRARKLIRLAAKSGADAAKFQNFRAPKIVSKRGFESLGRSLSHQAAWKKSVYEVYADASLPWEWTPILRKACDDAGIAYFSAPYDLEAVDMLNPHVPCFKIGSGDITWLEILEKVARNGKPVILSTGASDFADVKRVAENEADTVIIQRRCLRAARPLTKGTVLRREDIDVLRPAPSDGIFPYELGRVLGRRVKIDVAQGDYLRWAMLDERG